MDGYNDFKNGIWFFPMCVQMSYKNKYNRQIFYFSFSNATKKKFEILFVSSYVYIVIILLKRKQQRKKKKVKSLKAIYACGNRQIQIYHHRRYNNPNHNEIHISLPMVFLRNSSKHIPFFWIIWMEMKWNEISIHWEDEVKSIKSRHNICMFVNYTSYQMKKCASNIYINTRKLFQKSVSRRAICNNNYIVMNGCLRII